MAIPLNCYYWPYIQAVVIKVKKCAYGINTKYFYMHKSLCSSVNLIFKFEMEENNFIYYFLF